MEGASGIAVAAVLVAVYLILTVKLKKRFPDEDWRAYYTKSVPEPERLDEPHIQTSRARLAVVAVNADAAGLLGRKAAQNGIILFLFGGVEVA